MSRRGRMMYVPPVVIDEVNDLQEEHGINQRVNAFNKLADYARVGREVERLAKFDFRWAVTPKKVRK